MPGTNKIVVFLFVFFVQISQVSAQNKRTLNGSVTDAKTGETLIGASVKLVGNTTAAVMTNSYGFYSINTQQGSYEISISFVGYKTIQQNIEIIKDERLNFALEEDNQLTEVVISASKRNENVSSPQM